MAKEYRIFSGPKNPPIGGMVAGGTGPVFQTKEEAVAYCETQNATDPQNQYFYKEFGESAKAT